MADRREKVTLELNDGGFSTQMAKNAAATGLLERALKSLDGTTVNINQRFSESQRGVDGLGRSAANADGSINQLTGRLRLMADAAAVLGPALLPLGAGTIPVLAGLTAGLGAAAGALGVTILAANGFGDALNALNKAQLNPSSANIEKLTQELDKLGPAGIEFLDYIDSLGPKLTEVRNIAREGLFPGVEDGIDALLERLPQVERIVGDIASTLGGLSRDAGETLGGERFDSFFDYLDREAGPILRDFATATGYVVETLANMLVAVDPLTQSFSEGLVSSTRDLAKWSRDLGDNEGFQSFIDYVRENGPEALDFLGSLVTSLAAVAEAAAPVGDVVLPVLTSLLDIIGGIAGSDLGTPIFAGVAALAVYNRTLATTAALSKTAFGQGVKGAPAAGVTGAIGRQVGNTRRDLLYVASAQDRARMSASQLAEAQNRSRSAMLRTTGAAAGLALAASGLADKTELSNTATLALTGSFAGLAGAGIGASIGLLLDFAAANDEVEASVRAAATAVDSGDFSAGAQGLRELADARDALVKSSTNDTQRNLLGAIPGVGAITAGFDQRENSAAAEANREYQLLSERAADAQEAVAGLGDAFGMSVGPIDGSSRSLQELQDVLDAAQPIMEQAGITQEQLVAAFRLQEDAGGNGLSQWLADLQDPGAASAYDDLVQSLRDAADEMDSVEGRSAATRDALLSIGDGATTAAEAADSFKDALDALLDPQLNLVQSRDQFTSSLRSLSAELNQSSKALFGNSNAAIQNREVIGQRVARLKEMLQAEIGAGAGAVQVAAKFRNGRQALLDSAAAAGIGRDKMREYLNTLNLTPRFVRSLIEAAKADEATGKVRKLNDQLDKAGKQRTAVMNLTDRATGPAREIARQLDNAARDRSATITVRTVNLGSRARPDIPVPGTADGGTVPGPRYPYADKVYAFLAPGEEVITNRNGEADRFRADRASGRIPRYADGGTVGAFNLRNRDNDGNGTRQRLRELREALRDTVRELKGLSKRLEENRRTLQEMRQYRQSVGSSLAGDLTGNGLAGFDLGVRANANDARAATQSLRDARRRGLSGPLFDFIASSGDASLIESFGDLSRSQIRLRERQFAAMNRAQGALGDLAVAEKFGRSIDGLADIIRQQARRERNLTRRQRDYERRIEKATERGSERGTRRGNRDRHRGNGPRRRNRR